MLSKAPGPDGFSFLFYQSCWDIVKNDVMTLVHAYYHNVLDIYKLNMDSICLIPKKKDAKLITQFRPISLINYSFKIITKLLSNRLAPVMDKLISPTQTTYIKGINIMDNVVVTTEVLHYVKKKIKCILFKIDFEKTFDKFNWDFLYEILEGKCFSSLWISWIKNILYNSKTCINFNGKLGEYFYCKRGVR
jgi:Reverse transcriptase (RNA-dependent DNA polymerase)